MRAAWGALERQVAELDRVSTGLTEDDLAAVPEPAARYLGASIELGAPLAPAVRLTMRGSIKLRRWLPFRARQLLVPALGTVWEARIAGLISGGDSYVGGRGCMDWRLLGLARVVHAEGPDVGRSTAGRAAGESIWVPTAVVRPPGAWAAAGEDEITVDVATDGHSTTLHHEIDAAGRLRSSRFARWGDPDESGTWGLHPFGVEVTDHRTFGGVTIPNRGRAGWHHGTDRWEDGVFLRYEITGHELVG